MASLVPPAAPASGPFAGGGEMGGRIAEYDWDSSPLGPVAGWSSALLNTVSLILPADAQIVVFWGPQHVALYNDSYSPTIGNKHPQALGRPAVEYWGELWDDLEPLLRRVLETGETFSAKDRAFYIERQDYGEEVFFDVSYSAVREPDGSIGGVMCIVLETTDRVKAQRALTKSEESLRLAYEAAEVGKWDIDFATGRVDVSEQTRAIFDLPSGMSFEIGDLARNFHAEDDARVRAAFQAMIDPDRRARYDVEYRLIDPRDGTTRWLAAKGLGKFDEDGRCLRAIGTVIDITQRRAQQDALRESEMRFRSVADSAPAVIWMTDRDGSVTYMNSYAAEKYGVPPAELNADGWARLVHPDDLAEFAAAMPPILARRAPFVRDVRTIDHNREVRWMHCESRPRIVEGEFQGYIGCAIDVTESHEAAIALERAVAQRTSELSAEIGERQRVEATLTQMQRLEAVGQLTSGVAHDFNNLLTVVLGNLDMLERRGADALDERSRERLRHMRTAAERGATLTAQLLAFSRRTRLAATAVDLNETVATMRPLLESTLGGTVEIVADLTDDLWPAQVDATQIELAILNLAINARDAMEVGGRLTIGTDNATVDEDDRPGAPPAGDHVVVCVRDDGSGMPPEVAARAFEPFFTTKAVGKGSGLGLAQVYGFARQSGGGVTIETQSGVGTTVRIFLPRAGTTVAQPRAKGETPSSAAAPGACALVVDDDNAVRAVTAEMLRGLGYAVVAADGGKAALAQLREGAIDLVVADFAMPGMNGAELIRRIARLRPGLPTMIVTGYADLSAVAHLGEGRIVQKPFRAGELERKVAALMNVRA